MKPHSPLEGTPHPFSSLEQNLLNKSEALKRKISSLDDTTDNSLSRLNHRETSLYHSLQIILDDLDKHRKDALSVILHNNNHDDDDSEAGLMVKLKSFCLTMDALGFWGFVIGKKKELEGLIRTLLSVQPLIRIWVHQNPELGNVVYVMPGFISVVGCRIIPQELGPLGIEEGPILWASVFEVIGVCNLLLLFAIYCCLRLNLWASVFVFEGPILCFTLVLMWERRSLLSQMFNLGCSQIDYKANSQED